MNNIITKSRLDDQRCVGCGFELLDPKNAKLAMCNDCIKKAKTAAMKQIRKRKSRTGDVKRIRMKIAPHLVIAK